MDYYQDEIVTIDGKWHHTSLYYQRKYGSSSTTPKRATSSLGTLLYTTIRGEEVCINKEPSHG